LPIRIASKPIRIASNLPKPRAPSSVPGEKVCAPNEATHCRAKRSQFPPPNEAIAPNEATRAKRSQFFRAKRSQFFRAERSQLDRAERSQWQSGET
jgi:hypothetical protein